MPVQELSGTDQWNRVLYMSSSLVVQHKTIEAQTSDMMICRSEGGKFCLVIDRRGVCLEVYAEFLKIL